MVQMQAVYFVLGAVGLFAVGAFWGSELLWGALLYPRYWWWRATGGMRRLLYATGKASLYDLLDVRENDVGLYKASAHFWTHIPQIVRNGGEDVSRVIMPDTIPLGYCFARDIFCAAMNFASAKDATMAELHLHYVYACEGRDVGFRCHRRLSLAFAAFCTRELELHHDPVCGMPFGVMSPCPPRAMRAMALRKTKGLLRRLHDCSGVAPEKLFAIEERDEAGVGAYAVLEKNVAHYDVYFGEERALARFSRLEEVRLRPVTLEVVVPKCAVVPA